VAIPVWVPGQVLTASDINTWMVPNAIIKPSSQNVTSSTVLVNDTALVLPVAASASFIFTCCLMYQGGTRNASDLKFNWVLPSGASLSYVLDGVGPGGGTFAGASFNGAAGTLGTNGSGVLCGALFYGSLVISTTAGTAQFQWAQNTSSATATTVFNGSSLTLQRAS
jgi:hypothetical protein